MIRKDMVPRPDWPQKMEELGFSFHSIDGIYWDERACYEFTAAEIDTLEEATAELHEMCIAAAGHVIDSGDYGRFAIPAEFVPLIERSWNEDEATLFGRFDFSWDGSKGDAGAPKLLEYNADTPTSLIEASVAQWYWMQEVVTPRRAQADQFNSLHEKLIERWKEIVEELPGKTVHFTCVSDSEEDIGNLDYLRDVAMQGGVDAKHIDIGDIGWDAVAKCFNFAKEDKLFQLPRMEQAKKLLFQATLPFYKAFRSRKPDDAGLQFEEAIQSEMDAEHYRIIVDCEKLTYISSAGLGVFMSFIEEIREQAGGDIKICGLTPKVQQVFDILGFPEIYDMCASVPEAAQRFSETPMREG